LLLTALIAWWRQRHSLRARARRRLAGLCAAHAAGRIDNRDAAFQLAAIVRIALRITRIVASDPPAGVTSSHWASFADALCAARYARRAASDALMQRLLHEAEHWLRRSA
jgi:hypothetical protein